MIVKLPTKHYLEFLTLKGGCRGLSVSTLVKMSNCWKSHALAHFVIIYVVSAIFQSTNQFKSLKVQSNIYMSTYVNVCI